MTLAAIVRARWISKGIMPGASVVAEIEVVQVNKA
jgi:hypothetical protein